MLIAQFQLLVQPQGLFFQHDAQAVITVDANLSGCAISRLKLRLRRVVGGGVGSHLPAQFCQLALNPQLFDLQGAQGLFGGG